MNVSVKCFIASFIIVLALCEAQISGNLSPILFCLLLYLLLLRYACRQDFTLPLLLFFLPWSRLLKLSPCSFSFFTLGLVLACLIGIINNKFRFRSYQLETGLLLMCFTLTAKIISGYGLSFSYIGFIMMITLFPSVKEEQSRDEYSLYHAVVFFSAGIITAALCAQRLAEYSNITEYITIDAYLTITRASGFYGDPNYYAAQITAALSGCLILLLRERGAVRKIILWGLAFLLLYCGFLSGSKTFAIICACTVSIWLAALLCLRGRLCFKISLILGAVFTTVFIASSPMFEEMLDVLISRFSYVSDLSSLTTGRTDLWGSYLNEFSENLKTLLIGSGFTDVRINGRASHNTIIQTVFQLGLLGLPVLIRWIVCFFKNTSNACRPQKPSLLCAAVLVTGIFGPWLAIDTLFFDEFFLLQWYMFVSLREINSPRSSFKSRAGRRQNANRKLYSGRQYESLHHPELRCQLND